MKAITLNVYESDMITVKKTSTANLVKLPFGIVRKLMALFDVEKLDDTTEILKIVTGSWDSVTDLMSAIFSDIEDDEWDYVDTSELVAALLSVLKSKFAEILKIPTNSKN